jgi:insulysin
MRFKNFALFFLVLVTTTCAFGKGYEVIENKATLPLLDPTFAERKVAKLRLDNGLEAYLISDPETKQSAASISVAVGSWNDPEKYPGMAHFLEHMLFMGTKKYPEERAYWQYITNNGGMANAFTANDRTVYYFTINNDAFEGALDRFSHFFIDPLLSLACINRELHAVDQEHSKNVENDLWRAHMIFKECGNADHPNSKFDCGNAQTLGNIPQEALKKWHDDHYSANLMRLIVVSPLPLYTLIQLTSENFVEVPSFQASNKLKKLPLTSSKQLGHFTYIAPVKDLRQLILSWEVPAAYTNDLENQSAQVTAFALGHEGERSLLGQLKKEHLAENLTVFCDPEAKHDAFFRIQIDLTHQGLAQIDTVVERCFQAISRLKNTGIPHSLFKDMQKIAKLNYQYQSREDLFRFLYTNGYSIVDEDLASFPEKSNIPSSYNSGAITSFIQTLTPQNCFFTLLADPELTSIPMEQKEQWMAAEYTIKEVPHSKLTSWNESNLHPDIDLPGINPYIPTNFDLVKHPEAPSKPRVIYEQSDGIIYYQPDSTHMVPQLALLANIKTPLIDETAQKQTLLDIYLLALNDKLRSQTYFSRQAGFNINLLEDDFSLFVTLSGFHDKAPDLIKEIFSTMKHVAITSEQFEIYKQSLETDYENATKELPLIQARNLLNSVLTNNAPLPEEKLKALKTLTFDAYCTYEKELLQKCYFQMTLVGNLEQHTALSLWTELKQLVHFSPYPQKEHPSKQVLDINQNEGPYVMTKTTPMQGNGVILLVEQGPFTYEKSAAQQVLAVLLREGFFDTLRTKQQTGYIAQTWNKEVEKQLFQFFGVQSSTHNPEELLARFELFLEDFLRHFQDNVPAERFDSIKKAVITQLEMPPKNLKESASLSHALAFNFDGDFERRTKQAQAVKELSYDKLKQMASEYLSRANSKRLAVLVEGAPSQQKSFRYKALNTNEASSCGQYITKNIQPQEEN